MKAFRATLPRRHDAAPRTCLGHALLPHAFSAAAQLPDGTVLITGGQLVRGYSDAGAELYVPTTGAFALTGSMSAGRDLHTATLLTDGTVLIAGGYGLYPGATASGEIYHPNLATSSNSAD